MKIKRFVPGYPKNRGFSLVELIIVIAIMAILAAAIAPALIRYIEKSRRASDVETAGVILRAAQYAYSEGYSFEGFVGTVEQNADVVCEDNVVEQITGDDGETPYDLEIIAVASNGGVFTNTVNEQQHFLDLFRKTLGKDSNNNSKEFSDPKFRKNIGNGMPDGFLLGRRLNDSGQAEGFEVWIADAQRNPAYRLQPDCCSEYK
ncbi:prepilin-type N-terminal cleavage/methylation domain-containing protein [Lachnospiraceae bacterium NE2001]|nr:prepilin-type N-terminal cleavage/methylation domain-containing protein [Lachnospiraceae bacterium NE2001]